MKPTTLLTGRYLLPLLILLFSIGLISWDYQQKTGNTPQNQQDTLPKKVKEKKVKDLDEVLAELERTDLQVDLEMIQAEIANALKEFDGNKIRMEIDKAMKEVDMKAIQTEIAKAMKDFDGEKIQLEIEKAMKEVDMKAIQSEIAKAMKEADLAKIQQEVQAELAKVDWDKVKKEMDNVKEIDMKKLEVEMKKLSEEMKELGPKLEVEMKKAKAEIEKAKAEIKEYKTLVDGLDSDGLINKKEGYSLKHKDGVLLINDKKASEGVYNKYRAFLEKHPKFNINLKADSEEVIEL